jgi:GT2 family glycosyltransferase
VSKISIVIPVFNKVNFTLSCINDLLKLSCIDTEIIIVDNGSIDETKNKICELAYNNLNLIYERSEANRGFAVACNSGNKIATGDIVMFLNNDIKVRSDHNNWIQNIVNEIKDNILVGPTGGFVDPKNEFKFSYETNDNTKKINYMSGWCLAALKTTWNKLIVNDIGPFCEDFFCYFEDTDLSFRAQELDIKFKLVNIPVVHFGKTSSNQLNTHALYNNARKIFIKKWNK